MTILREPLTIQRRLKGAFALELLEARLCLSSMAFVTHHLECCMIQGVDAVQAADLDADGDTDGLFVSQWDDTIGWAENIDGRGTFGPTKIISASAEHATLVDAVDIDNDGDLDAMTIADGRITTYANIDGKGNFGDGHALTDSYASVFYPADLDGDGAIDLVSASDRIGWHKNDGIGSFERKQNISGVVLQIAAVGAADVDG